MASFAPMKRTTDANTATATPAPARVRSFRTTHVEKLATRDHFATGCETGSRCILSERLTLEAPTFAELVAKAKQWAGGMDRSAYVFLPDGAESRTFGFSQQETAEGTEPSSEEREDWKRGEADLFLCDYTFTFEVVERAALTASDLEGLTLG